MVADTRLVVKTNSEVLLVSWHRRQTAFEPDGLVFVAMNYRLGAFGWSAGPTIQSDGAANVGLLDQRLALDWVQKHIA